MKQVTVKPPVGVTELQMIYVLMSVLQMTFIPIPLVLITYILMPVLQMTYVTVLGKCAQSRGKICSDLLIKA